MDVVTLGMFILDEIHFRDGSGRPSAIDVLGGAGSWAVIGARAFRPSASASRIGWTVHKGADFPAKIADEIASWNTSCNFIDTPNRPTTRGWNEYGSHEKRAFKYTTEKWRIDETQLTEPMLRSRCFHMICTPTRCINLVNGILDRRSTLGYSKEDRPLFVWEPTPDSCGPGELRDLLDALKYVDVVSPNHQELAALFQTDTSESSLDSRHDNLPELSRRLLQRFAPGKGAVVVRCGDQGCYIDSSDDTGYLPAYHQSSQLVVDPTGAGNAFLGAFCIGMLDADKAEDRVCAGAVHGSVAAGCAVEQVGLPTLTKDGNDECWNGVSMKDRLDAYDRLLIKRMYA